MTKPNLKHPLTNDHVLIRALAEEKNAQYREQHKEEYIRIKRCEKSRFWRWFYRIFKKKRKFDASNPLGKPKEKTLQEVAEDPVELEKALRKLTGRK